MKQRLVIARALVNAPRVLFLDEPTRGLDPVSSREIRDLIVALAGQGTTIFLTTHYMNEADELCDRVAFLKEGKIVALDSPPRAQVAVRSSLRPGLARHPRRARIDLASPADAQTVLLQLDDARPAS